MFGKKKKKRLAATAMEAKKEHILKYFSNVILR